MIERHPPNETPMMPMPERKRTKRITAHSDQELDSAVSAAVDKFGDDFWLMLYGIDAYMERRKRRYERARFAGADELVDPWGNS